MELNHHAVAQQQFGIVLGGYVLASFDIFLSHNSADKPPVECIAQKLKTVGLAPWLDKWCLVPGQSWQYELANALRSCPTCGIFVGQNGLGDWAREELLVAQDRATKEPNFRLIPILRPGVHDPFDYSKLPPFLTQRTWVDFRSGLDEPEPLRTLINAIKGLPPGSGSAAEGRFVYSSQGAGLSLRWQHTSSASAPQARRCRAPWIRWPKISALSTWL